MLAGYRPRTGTPWRFERAFWTIPLGLGAVGLLAWQAGRRLSLAPSRRRTLATWIAGAAAATLALAALSQTGHLAAALIWERPAAVAVYFAAKVVLALPDRGYHYYAGGDRAYGPFLPAALRVLVPVALVEAALIAFATTEAAP